MGPEWTSGYTLAAGADILIHDSQYTDEEYRSHMGWGHSSLSDTMKFAGLTGVKKVVPFHHDPGHDDKMLDEFFAEAAAASPYDFELVPAVEGMTFDL